MQASVVATDLEVNIEGIGKCISLACIVLVLQANELNALFINLFDTFKPVENIRLLKASVTERILAQRILDVVQSWYRSARQICCTRAHTSILLLELGPAAFITLFAFLLKHGQRFICGSMLAVAVDLVGFN